MLGLWITLAVLLALAIFLWRLRLGLYVVFGRGQAAADLTIGPFRVRLVPSKETKKRRRKPKKRESLKRSRRTWQRRQKNPEAQTGRSSGRRKDAVARRQKGSAPHPAGYPRRPAAPVRHPGRGGGPGGSRRVVRWTPRPGLDRDAGSGEAGGDPGSRDSSRN